MRTRAIAEVVGRGWDTPSTTVSRPMRAGCGIVQDALEPMLARGRRERSKRILSHRRRSSARAGSAAARPRCSTGSARSRPESPAFARSYCEAGTLEVLRRAAEHPRHRQAEAQPRSRTAHRPPPARRRGRLVASVVKSSHHYSSTKRRWTAQCVSSWRLESCSLRRTGGNVSLDSLRQMPSWAAISLYMYPRAMCWRGPRACAASAGPALGPPARPGWPTKASSTRGQARRESSVTLAYAVHGVAELWGPEIVLVT